MNYPTYTCTLYMYHTCTVSVQCTCISKLSLAHGWLSREGRLRSGGCHPRRCWKGTGTGQGASGTGPPAEWASLPTGPAARRDSERDQHWREGGGGWEGGREGESTVNDLARKSSQHTAG